MNYIIQIVSQHSSYFGIVLTLATSVFGLAAWPYYDRVLQQEGPDRQRLLERLTQGGFARAFYVDLMTVLLDQVDRFFGDSQLGQKWVAHIVGLAKPRPCWTSHSFDACALLAVMYPIASLVVTWLIVGDAGAIGHRVDLGAVHDPWLRLCIGFTIGGVSFSVYCFARAHGWRSLAWLIFMLIVMGIGGALIGAICSRDVYIYDDTVDGYSRFSSGALALAYFIAFIVVFYIIIAKSSARFVSSSLAVSATGASAVIGIVGVAFLISELCVFQDSRRLLLGSILLATLCGVGGSVIAFNGMALWAKKRNKLGVFWVVFWPIAISAVGLSIWVASKGLYASTPVNLIVIIAVLPLINLPFDWLSIGTTRALLRRGCENHGIWYKRSPAVLGFVDCLVGVLLLMALGFVLILAFLIIAKLAKGDLMNAANLIESLQGRYGEVGRSNDWLYFTLLSTMLPSFANLVVGIFTLLTVSFHPLRVWLISVIPTLDAPGHNGTRWQATFALSANWFVAILISGTAIWLLWLAILDLPVVKRFALNQFHEFAVDCSYLFGVSRSPDYLDYPYGDFPNSELPAPPPAPPPTSQP